MLLLTIEQLNSRLICRMKVACPTNSDFLRGCCQAAPGKVQHRFEKGWSTNLVKFPSF